MFTPGVLAIKSPSMEKPPAGAMSGAIPPGGGVAKTEKLQSNSPARKSSVVQRCEVVVRREVVSLNSIFPTLCLLLSHKSLQSHNQANPSCVPGTSDEIAPRGTPGALANWFAR